MKPIERLLKRRTHALSFASFKNTKKVCLFSIMILLYFVLDDLVLNRIPKLSMFKHSRYGNSTKTRYEPNTTHQQKPQVII